MSRRTVHHASGQHRSRHAILPPRVHARSPVPLEDDEALVMLDVSADEWVDAEVQDHNDRMTDGTIPWLGARRDSWEADEDRAEVDRFLRDHFASDELEFA